ncbi:MAG: DUF6516 family protein [Steroidobacteraceae bacterium]
MIDEAMQRLLAYDRRRYWLVNGWSIRFRIGQVVQTVHRPHGIKYSFTLHDADGTRLLGFDNAHGVSRALSYDHRHRFEATSDLLRYDFRGTDQLLCDFFAAVEQACNEAGVPFEFDLEDVDIEEFDAEDPDDDSQVAR